MDKGTDYWLSICPFEASEADIRSLSTKSDGDWPPHTWEELKLAIATKEFSHLTRRPTDLRNYILWRREMSDTYSDISQYIVTHRLGWPLPTDEGFDVRNRTPFADPADYSIRRNDWPYALEDDVSHIVVWLKTRISIDELGDPTPESAIIINEFVERIFRSEVKAQNSSVDVPVMWFKNRVQWQSVRSLEHIHILLKGVDDRLVERWTGQKESDTVGHSWSRTVIPSTTEEEAGPR